MTELILIRHGQASLGQDNYDALSELGSQQARWLGEHFTQSGARFDAVISGSLVRQVDTLAQIAPGQPAEQDPRFNEFDFMQVVNAYLHQHPAQRKDQLTRRDWFTILRDSMQCWSHNDLALPQGAETWQGFATRVHDAIHAQLNESYKRVLVVTSGGVIAMAMGHALGLDAAAIIRLNLQIQNTSVTRFFCSNQHWSLHSFNCLPHLSSTARAESVTYA